MLENDGAGRLSCRWVVREAEAGRKRSSSRGRPCGERGEGLCVRIPGAQAQGVVGEEDAEAAGPGQGSG